jgi:hypothetical protein
MLPSGKKDNNKIDDCSDYAGQNGPYMQRRHRATKTARCPAPTAVLI